MWIRENLVQLGRCQGDVELLREVVRRSLEPPHDAGDGDPAVSSSLCNTPDGEGVFSRNCAVAEDRNVHVCSFSAPGRRLVAGPGDPGATPAIFAMRNDQSDSVLQL